MRPAQRHFDPKLLRLVVITDGRGDLLRLQPIVRAAVDGGARCVQLREPKWSARVLMDACERLRPVLDQVGGMLLVNDRIDVAATGVAHGAQVGHRSLPPDVARRLLGPDAVLGYSAHDPGELDLAADGGCDFALLSPIWPTDSKPGLPHLGEARAATLTAAARLPIVWLGGITAAHAVRIASLPDAQRPVGIAVRGAVMLADDPQLAVAALLGGLASGGAADPAAGSA